MQHILDVQHLAKRFGSAEVLSDINFSLAPGEVVSIIGIFYGGQDYETLLHGDPEDGGADG